MYSDETRPLDDMDRRIVGLLAADGRMPVAAVAEQVALSRSATSDRIRRLERDGWIVGYRAVVSPRVTGRTLEAVVGLRARSGADRAHLEAWIGRQPAIVEALHLTGPHDYVLRLRCRDTSELDQLLMSMKNDAEIGDTETRVVLRHLDVTPDVV